VRKASRFRSNITPIPVSGPDREPRFWGDPILPLGYISHLPEDEFAFGVEFEWHRTVFGHVRFPFRAISVPQPRLRRLD
jgi:hypothetical protein